MKYNVYAIRDDKTSFLSPIVSQNDAEAMRNFEHAVMQTSSLYYTHASDFSLYKIGTFDSSSGVLESVLPEHILSGSDIKVRLDNA